MPRRPAPALAAVIASLSALSASAYAVSLKAFVEPQVGFEVGLPQSCRHEVSAGTIEAICAPGLDAAKAQNLAAAGAWLFEIDYEIAPKDAQPYTSATLRDEAAQMVCGDSPSGAAVVRDMRELTTAGGTAYAATVTCPALDFLKLPERAATVKVVIAGERRFRMFVRTPASDSAAAEPAARAFLDSFKLTAR